MFARFFRILQGKEEHDERVANSAGHRRHRVQDIVTVDGGLALLSNNRVVAAVDDSV
jgi:hypothetical protein